MNWDDAMDCTLANCLCFKPWIELRELHGLDSCRLFVL
jgi:hypothetical protein